MIEVFKSKVRTTLWVFFSGFLVFHPVHLFSVAKSRSDITPGTSTVKISTTVTMHSWQSFNHDRWESNDRLFQHLIKCEITQNSDSKRIWVTGFIYFVYRHNLSTNAKKATLFLKQNNFKTNVSWVSILISMRLNVSSVICGLSVAFIA